MTTRKSSRNRKLNPKMWEYQKNQERDKKDKKKFYRGGIEYSFSEICEMCNESGALCVACDGCSAFFHLRCMDLTEEDLAELSGWTCNDCKNFSHYHDQDGKDKDVVEEPKAKRKREKEQAKLRAAEAEMASESDGDHDDFDKDQSLPYEIANKYRNYSELVSVHLSNMFKGFHSKSQAQKDEILQRCNEELHTLMLSSCAHSEVKLNSNSVEDKLALFSQFLSWQRMMRLYDMMPKRMRLEEPDEKANFDSALLEQKELEVEGMDTERPRTFGNTFSPLDGSLHVPAHLSPSKHQLQKGPPPTQPPPPTATNNNSSSASSTGTQPPPLSTRGPQSQQHVPYTQQHPPLNLLSQSRSSTNNIANASATAANGNKLHHTEASGFTAPTHSSGTSGNGAMESDPDEGAEANARAMASMLQIPISPSKPFPLTITKLNEIYQQVTGQAPNAAAQQNALAADNPTLIAPHANSATTDSMSPDETQANPDADMDAIETEQTEHVPDDKAREEENGVASEEANPNGGEADATLEKGTDEARAMQNEEAESEDMAADVRESREANENENEDEGDIEENATTEI